MDRRGASHGEHPPRLDQHRQRGPGVATTSRLLPHVASADHRGGPAPRRDSRPSHPQRNDKATHSCRNALASDERSTPGDRPLFEDVRGGQLLESFGCTEVDVIFYGSCLDDDATLTSLEAWEALRDPDDAVGSAAFIAEGCSSVPESAALRHYLVARDGSWRLSGEATSLRRTPSLPAGSTCWIERPGHSSAGSGELRSQACVLRCPRHGTRHHCPRTTPVIWTSKLPSSLVAPLKSQVTRFSGGCPGLM